jgi:hypothetical protein
MPYNLQSPNGIGENCDLSDLEGWFSRELSQIPSEPERAVLATVAGNLDFFVRWADEAILLWPGCNRVPEPGRKQKYFSYPNHIKRLARARRSLASLSLRSGIGRATTRAWQPASFPKWLPSSGTTHGKRASRLGTERSSRPGTRWLRLSAGPGSASGGSGAGRRKAAAPRRGAAALQSCLPGLAFPDTAGKPAV